MTRHLIAFLLVVASGCAVAPTTAVPDAPPPPPPELSASLLVSWSGQDITSSNPNDSRVPRTPTGPQKACPNVVGDDVVQVAVEVVIGTAHAYVSDVTLDCALGQTTIPVPAGSGMFRLDVYTALGYAWLASYSPITTVDGQTTDAIANLNNEIPTSSGGGDGDGDGDGDGGGLGGYL